MSWSFYALAAAGAVSVFTFLRTWKQLTRRRPPARRPFVSVLVLVRDQQDTIEAFLRPMLSGSLGNGGPTVDYELIVVDAGSADDTWAILSRLAHKHPGVRLLRWHPADGGADPLQAGHVVCQSRVTVAVRLLRAEDVPEARAALTALLRGAPTRRSGSESGSHRASRPAGA